METEARSPLWLSQIETVPYAAPRDYRNALPLMDDVVADNSGLAHFNGGNANQTSYTLDSFNLSNPVTGYLDARPNIDTIQFQSMTVESSRYSAGNDAVPRRAWFHEGLNNFYNNDVISGLPERQNRTSALSSSSISRVQVNLTPANILSATLLVNRDNVSNQGLSFLNPEETIVSQNQMFFI